MHVIAVGGSDAGISVALRARELDPTVEVTVVVADAYPNFSICGIPYYISGEVSHWRNLAHRTYADLEATGMRLRLDTLATRIDVADHRLWVRNPDGSLAMQSLRGDDLGRGGDLFRLNCASCHNFTGKGGALSSGKYAPDLGPANEQQILAAMLTGPQNMPKFSDRQLSFEAKKDIIGYVKTVSEERQPGGYGLGGFGPAPEGMAFWIIGMVAAIGLALWIGARAQ